MTRLGRKTLPAQMVDATRAIGRGHRTSRDDVQSLAVYTAGFPAEYGRKMGGVVEVKTLQDAQPGFHGQAVLSGGSFDSGGAFAQGQYLWGKNVLGASVSGDTTGHHLNPVVPQNFNNIATIGDFSANCERSLTPNDRLTLIVRHEFSRYGISNELVQEQAGQHQTADNVETMGTVSYQHVFSTNMVGDFRGMVRDNANDFYSNAKPLHRISATPCEDVSGIKSRRASGLLAAYSSTAACHFGSIVIPALPRTSASKGSFRYTARMS